MKKILLGVTLLFSLISVSQVKETKKESASYEYDFKSLPIFKGRINTKETIPVYDKPDLVNGLWLGNIVGEKLEIIKKENDKYYLVKFNKKIGYVFVGYIMKHGTKQLKK